MSITLAAQDLCLTQSAVSRQIHALEKQLGIRLLVRGYRSIALTPAGEHLFRSADRSVQELQDVLGEVSTSSAARPVTLSASIGVTGLWLLPRLTRFQQLYPGVDLRISANNNVVNLRNDGIDLAIRYTSPSEAPEGAVRLFGESVAPVMHPSLGVDSLRSGRDLSKLNLLEFDDPHHPWLQWNDWLTATGWSNAKPRGMLHFNQYDQLIQAAIAGQGVALGRLELIQPVLDDRKLSVVASPQVHASHAYWLIQADVDARPDVRRVAGWIESEVKPELRRSTGKVSQRRNPN